MDKYHLILCQILQEVHGHYSQYAYTSDESRGVAVDQSHHEVISVSRCSIPKFKDQQERIHSLFQMPVYFLLPSCSNHPSLSIAHAIFSLVRRTSALFTGTQNIFRYPHLTLSSGSQLFGFFFYLILY